VVARARAMMRRVGPQPDIGLAMQSITQGVAD
jgi:hypothetical protein